MRAKMLLLAPSPAALARFAHDANWHVCVSPVLTMQSFYFFEPFDFHIEALDLLQ
jgi:hypothetical protein